MIKRSSPFFIIPTIIFVMLIASAALADDVRLLWKGEVAEKLQKNIPEIISAHRREMKKAKISLMPERQAKEETALIEKKLRSEGYYDATITPSANKAVLALRLTPGAASLLAESR